MGITEMEEVPTVQDLIRAAEEIQGSFELGDGFSAGAVGAALRTKSGNIYTGICIELACGIGFCAEHSAVAEMLKHRETEIEAIVAVSPEGIIPPCGRCRELLAQVSAANLNTRVLLDRDEVVLLRDLLPHRWY
ncbi:MAG: cytidine deaminase [Bacillota bacterium]